MNKRVEIEHPFEMLAKINVNDHVEKKQNLSYLSWAWAVDQLMRVDPMANWEFHDPVMFGNTMMVSCTVTAFNKPITMHLPVMDHRNKAIENPDAFAVNKNMMRCLVKAIACHGLGLYIYAGEDLPEGEEKPEAKEKTEDKPRTKVTPAAGCFEGLDEAKRREIQGYAEEVTELIIERDDIDSAWVIYDSVKDAEERAAFRSLLDSKVKTALRKYSEAANNTIAELASQA